MEEDITLVSQEYADKMFLSAERAQQTYAEIGVVTNLESKVTKAESDIVALGTDAATTKGRVDTIEGNVASIENDVTSVKTGKQDKLTAGDNITITADNVISASGGSEITPQAIQNIFSTYATETYLDTMANMTIYYDANIARSLPSGQTPYTTNWEINECCYFPEKGYFIPMEAMVPKIVTTEDNVYVGVVRSAKAGDIFDSLFIVTHKPIETKGTYFNVSFVYANCKDNSIGSHAGPCESGYCWTGWLDSSKDWIVGQFRKKTVDDKEVYEFISSVSKDSTLIPYATQGLDLQKTSGPTGCPQIIGIDGFHIVTRAQMYPNVPVQMSYRYAFAPYHNKPLVDIDSFVTEYDAKLKIAGKYDGDRNKIATREFVYNLAVEKLLDTPWDMTYAPYQPDLVIE